MTGLDEPRVRRFAAGQKVQNLDDFMAQIDAADLGSTASLYPASARRSPKRDSGGT
jgi:hypothetical protein